METLADMVQAAWLGRAVLALSEAIMAGVEVSPEFMKKAQDIFLKAQRPDGGWSYTTGGSTPNMATAGLASMFLVFDMYHGKSYYSAENPRAFTEGDAAAVLKSLERMRGGEVYVPKIPSMRVTDLARAIAPECETRNVGIRPGEKLHEVLVSEDDARHTVEHEDYYAVLPAIHSWDAHEYTAENGGRPCPDGFCYCSDKNTRWLSVDELRTMAGIVDGKDVITGD